jgi:hypothetical protein
MNKKHILLVLCFILGILICIPACTSSDTDTGVDVTGAGPGISGNPVTAGATIAWQVSTIGESGEMYHYPYLTTDRNGRPHICFTMKRNEFDYSLMYATQERGAWKIETIDDQSSVLAEAQVVTDQSGYPHIVYGYLLDGVSAEYGIKYAHKDRFGWHIETLTTIGQTYGNPSIAVDIRGTPHIAYISYPDAGLNYAKKTSHGWDITTVDTSGDMMWPTIRLDRNGDPHIVYTLMEGWSHREKWYTERDSTGWHTELLDTNYSGRFTGFDLDLLGTPHIAFMRITGGIMGSEIAYLTKDRSGWQYATIATGELDEYVSLAVRNTGGPGISYSMTSNSDNTVVSDDYAWKSSGTWHYETVATADEYGTINAVNPVAYGSGTQACMVFSTGSGGMDGDNVALQYAVRTFGLSEPMPNTPPN